MHATSYGSDPDPLTPEQEEHLHRRMGPPENELPSPVALSVVLARTPDLAMALVDWQAYSTGVAFTLAVRLRVEPTGRHRHGVFELLHGGGWGEQGSAEGLMLGFELADGRRVSNLTHGHPWPPASADPQAPLLVTQGGGGGGRRYDQEFWWSPVPPAGPLLAVCAVPALGVPETQVALDGSGLREAADRVEQLWPYEPERRQDEPDRPVLPASGWFADG